MNEPLNEDIGLNIRKNGESCISMILRRNMGGLTLSVKTHPNVEEFFKNNSASDHYDVRAAGRHWSGLDKEAPLYAYQIVDPIPIIQLDTQRRVRFDKLGTQLILVTNAGDRDQPLPTGLNARFCDINMSFLRLVGIGQGDGVTFNIRGVFSDRSIESLRDDIADAGKKFYQTYMKPINMNVSIITQEW